MPVPLQSDRPTAQPPCEPRFLRFLLAFISFWTAPALAQPADEQHTPAEVQRLVEAQNFFAAGSAAAANKEYEKAVALYLRAYEGGATAPTVPYNTACCFALLKRPDDAFKYLDVAIRHGWTDLDHLNADPDLESLRSDARWKDVTERCAVKRAEARKLLGDPDLHDEIMKRMKVDQEARLAEKPSPSAMMRIDADNTAWMKGVVEKHGWPGIALLGRDGAQAAWLLIQHADADTAFQRRCLDLLTVALEKGDATAQQVAYLTDRVLLAEGKSQVYGTQFWTIDGKLQPRPIENEADVDQRRRMGLEPLAVYAEQMRSLERK